MKDMDKSVFDFRCFRNNEIELLEDFINWWSQNYPDVVNAWNGKAYDYHLAGLNKYLHRRDIKTVLWGCSVEPDVMKNPDTGFTEGRQYSFYDVYGFNRLAVENKEALASELVNSANNYRVEIGLGNKPEEKMENETPEQACKRELKERISKMETVPEYKKQRVYDVLDAIDKNGKIKVVDEPEYLEHIAMRSDRGVYGYYLVQKMMDYSGSTQGRRFIPLNSKTLVAYVEEHKDALDKELRKRSQIQEK